MTHFSCPPGSQDCVGQCGVSRRGERLFHCADALQGQTFIDLTHSKWLGGRFRRSTRHNINQRWLFCVVFYSSSTASVSLSVKSQLNKNRQTVKKVSKVKRFPFLRWSHRSWDKYMMADIQRIKGFQYVDANQSFSGTFYLLLWFNVILMHVWHFLACGSGNVVLILDLSSCGSWPSFLNYPASLKTSNQCDHSPNWWISSVQHAISSK